MKARWLNTVAIGLLASPAAADAPRGSSYAEDVRETEEPAPVQSLVSETDSTADLTLKRAPSKAQLKMRPKAVSQATKAEPAEKDGEASVSTGYKPFPTTARDFRERVTFRIRAGVELDAAAANGDTQRGGLPLDGNFSDNRAWILGDAIVGARGIITPSLNGYFLSSFAFDAAGADANNTATVLPYDQQEVVIKAGYAEWGRDDRKPDDQQPRKVWLRGGRQFRLDGGNMFAYFDGVTVGYKDRETSLSAFAGRRVALFINTQNGLLFGATAGANLKALKTKVWLDYTGLDICVQSCFDDPEDLTDDNNLELRTTRHLVSLNTTTRIGRKLKLDLRARLTGLEEIDRGNDLLDPNDDTAVTTFAPARMGGRLRYEAEKLVMSAEVEQRFADDIAYDLASPTSADVVNLETRIGVLNTPINSTLVGVRADWLNKKRTAELVGFARARVPGDTPITTDQKGYVEFGGGIAGSPIGVRGSGVYTTAQYTFREFTNEGIVDGMNVDGACLDFTDLDMDGLPDNCKTFGDSASSGIDRMHQLAADATLASRGGGGRRWRFSAGGFFRVFDFGTPYRQVKNDPRGGGRLDLHIWINRDLHVEVIGEVAQPSPTLARELGLMSALRATLEARW